MGFRDGKLAHENIYWDQASVLKQIGLLNGPQHAVPTEPKPPARCSNCKAKRTKAA